MKTVSRVYDTHADACAAVAALEEAGVPSKDISLVANKCVRMLAGLGILTIPGLGPVVAAGWLASIAVGAAAGAAAGGVVGALVDAGLSKEHADVYSESVRRGCTLVSARVSGREGARIQAILDRYKPINPVERGGAYRREGWTGFDPKAPEYRPSEAEIERIRRSGPS